MHGWSLLHVMYIMMYMTRVKTNRRMVRKQVYLQPQQNAQLKRAAKARATTEAEVIREALEIVLNSSVPVSSARTFRPDQEAWQKLLKSMKDQRKRAALIGEPHRWTREEYYDDERYQRPWAK